MVTQTAATGEQATGKRRGRPRKYGVTLKSPVPVRGEKGTAFQKLIKAYNQDTLVKGYSSLRRKLFNSGEPVDQITASLKRRIADLQQAQPQH